MWKIYRASNMRFIFKLSPLILVLMQISCSYRAEFIINNTSADEMLVVFRLPNLYPYLSDNGPRLKKSADIDSGKVEWVKNSEVKYKYDKENYFATITLPPKSALLIAVKNNYFKHKYYEQENYEKMSITISGARGDICYRGFKAIEAFEPQKDFRYVLSY